jgi:hypothetical protein
MIDLTIDAPYDPRFTCECGDPECLGPADAVIPVVEALAESLPQLQSPLLKLIKERNEARQMCEVLASAMPDLAHVTTSPKAMAAASDELHTALITYVKLRKNWDERSWK